MPYDPALPANGSPLVSAELRSQLNGLKDLIDALPFINAAQVDGVTTLNPADPPTAGVNRVGGTLHFSFGIPQGQQGQVGPLGGVGPIGPPLVGVVVDGVLNLPPGDLPTVAASFDGTNVHFTFGLPRGFDGNTGGQGDQGQPGEVSLLQLNSAITGTSSNSNGVSTLGMTVSDPPTQGEMQQVVAKLDDLIAALRR